MGLASEPSVRLNPDFSVAQVDLDRRTVVLLYDAPEGDLPEEIDLPRFEASEGSEG